MFCKVCDMDPCECREHVVIPSPADMQEAMAKDRGCCFLVFYHVTKNLQNFQRATVLCEECRIEWLVQRIGELGVQMFPIGVKPRIELVREGMI